MDDVLITALKESGSLLLNYFNKPVKTRIKESQSSIVTEADIKSENKIISVIRKKYPKHNIISEEKGFIDNKSEYTWIIDPLDGTSNYASGIPWFGVLITLFKGNIPFLAGAYLPFQDLLYLAEKGKGSFRNRSPMPLIKEKEFRDSLFSFCMDYTENQVELQKSFDIYKFIINNSCNIRSTNSLIDFIYVAEGKFGGVVNLFTRVWDISGLGLLITETGGIVKNLSGGEIEFKISEELKNKNFPVLAGSFNIVNQFRL